MYQTAAPASPPQQAPPQVTESADQQSKNATKSPTKAKPDPPAKPSSPPSTTGQQPPAPEPVPPPPASKNKSPSNQQRKTALRPKTPPRAAGGISASLRKMGKKSKNGNERNSTSNGTHQDNNAPPATRQRVDSWAKPEVAAGEASSIATVEQQWKYLWKTQSQHLLDPADVVSCLGALQSQVTNRLSPSEITFIQRRVRSILRSIASQPAPSKMGRVFSTSQNANNFKSDARALAQQQHLLNFNVIRKLWKPRKVADVDVVKNAYNLMLYMSDTLWARVAEVARQSATAAKLEMDVNKKILSKQEWSMPKPSVVPDLAEPPALPPGIAQSDFVFLMALARRGSRVQRLQLLFYLCLGNDKLTHFLNTHPAGGVPCWLFEVGQGQVVSLASLTHYHYYGTAFVPYQSEKQEKHSPPSLFVRSKSREPVSISAAVVMDLVRQLLASVPGEGSDGSDGGAPENGSASKSAQQSNNGSSPARRKSGNGLMGRIGSSDKLSNLTNSNHASVDENGSGNPSGGDNLLFAPSEVMQAISGERSSGEIDYEDPALPVSINNLGENPEGEWTLEEFSAWAERSLDDVALDACFHRLFCVKTLPSFSTERNLVEKKYDEWRNTWEDVFVGKNGAATFSTLRPTESRSSWGGFGGVDGRGGFGYGVMYCVGKQWWHQWTAYTGYGSNRRRGFYRPGDISSERLLEKESDHYVPGTLGSYELMKEGLIQDEDYILVPSGVWDVLFELYGGGPPLPRMVLPPADKGVQAKNWESTISVAVRPWVIQCFLCDPTQPYRRGDVGRGDIGAIAFQIMVMPGQPLWRVFGEVVSRSPLQSYKVFDSEGKGMGRIWKKMPAGQNQPKNSAYGPWNLLCKNRYATLPVSLQLEENSVIDLSKMDEIEKNWQAYTEGSTVEEVGLSDGDQIMFEFAVVNKSGKLHWPRELAAKAGMERRIKEEDDAFSNLLQGLDKDGNVMLKPPKLVGMEVDAMDSSGRWYLVKILEVDIHDEDTDEEDEAGPRSSETKAKKMAKVSFEGGHIEWIDVESDQIKKAGRFTNEAEKADNGEETKNGGASNGKESDAKNKGPVTVKKTNAIESSSEATKLCTLPGYGACGLTNLGNTCYLNSAVQCISYMPLLRAYLLSGQYKARGDLNKDNPLGTGGRLLEEFADLLRAMWSTKYGEKMPQKFRQKLGNINDQFSAGDQQDAQEFLNYMMDVLHEDSNKVRSKPYVEALEDDWVARNNLARVGDEAWHRFLRRNQSIMADVAMGQVLNTVTCPVCKYASRNFDPFNLLSIPVPTMSDVIFQVVVMRRATALNCPWTLNKARKGDKKNVRFNRRNAKAASGPPSDQYVAEQYVIAMSRLADSSELRQQIQKVCGIPGTRLRLCRGESVVVDDDAEEKSSVRTLTKIVPMTEKEGPCSQLAMKKAPNQDVVPPTLLVVFEHTLKPRSLKSSANGSNESLDDTADEDEDGELPQNYLLPTAKEEKVLRKYLEVYGDEKECRIVDTDPIFLSKALSKSLWPRSENEFKVGLRVDAKDKRGNWCQGSVVEILEKNPKGDKKGSAQKAVKVHFDNFASKWDEPYTIEHFEEGKLQPLHTRTAPRVKPTDFYVNHKYLNRESDEQISFGQPFAIQCYTEWTGARAGAQILAQASRFLQYSADWSSQLDLDDPKSMDRENKATRLYEKTQTALSDLIDLLIDCDREYVKLGLGLSSLSTDEKKGQPFRNPAFDSTNLCNALDRKVVGLLSRLPFEVRIETASNPANSDDEDETFPFSLVRTIGNILNARQSIVLHWKELPADRRAALPPGSEPILYVAPPLETDEGGLDILKKSQKAGKEKAKRARPGGSGIDLGVCLTEFCRSQSLSLDDNWRCPQCKDFREGRQNMNLWRLPDVLTFHIKRFNMSARWREKISTRVNFPLTGLDLSQWCHKQSPVIQQDSPDSHVYDLIGVVNHYGSMTGGHYIATCKATSCGKDGREEVAYDFNGMGATLLESEGTENSTGWRLGRGKAETNQGKESAAMAAKAAAESAEPMWLQFDDELVDPIPPNQVVSEMAYVLFYRRRRVTPSNIAKYSTLE